MRKIPIDNSLFRILRITTLLFFCFWVAIIVFDAMYMGNTQRYTQFIKQSYTHQEQPEVEVNDIEQLVRNIPSEKYVQLDVEQVKNYNIVIFWTGYFGGDMLHQDFHAVPDNFNHKLKRPKFCYEKYPNCLITNNRIYLNRAGVILFHWSDFNQFDLPATRNPDQLWTLYNLEPPINTFRLAEDGDQAVFNLTATYMRDSDIFQPYGIVAKRKIPLADSDPRLKVDLTHKSKPIAWFVSNCYTESRREEYVEKLSSFIEVDIYGHCGSYSCHKSRDNRENCYRMVAQKYLFYLSFENSFCRDYVTEKVFYIMSYDIIPVVYGESNYSSILPPNSYIDASTMRPEKLAKLLIEISHDQEKYQSYFAWRQYYVLEQDDQYNELLFCKFCQLMTDQKNLQRKKSFPIDDKVDQTRPKSLLRKTSHTTKEINKWFFNSCNFTKQSLLID